MKKNVPVSIALLVCSLCILCCNNAAKKEAAVVKDLTLANINSSIKPGDNFYLFANGKWYDTATILPSESRAGAGVEMYYRLKNNIKSILKTTSAAKAAAGTVQQKVGDLYASGMDTATIEAAGYKPVKPLLNEIANIADARGIITFAARQTAAGNPLLMGIYVGADEKNSSRNIAVFYQAGLGLPDRDYYFKNDAATEKITAAYKNYCSTLFALTGTDTATAAKNALTLYNLEKQMAASHRTNVALRDPQSNYNKKAVTALAKQMPVLNWPVLLNDLKIKADSLNISQPDYYAKLDELIATVPLATWKIYLQFHVLDNAAPYLSSPFVKASFNYNGKTLNGQKEMKERWEQVYGIIDENLGEALGELYVKEYFTDDAKQRMLELVNNVQKAFEMRVKKLDWMTDSTKQKAIEKSGTFIKKIGFPDKWRDYSKVNINRNDFFANVMACAANEYAYQAAKVGKPVDRTEWGMTPPTINAYYNPTFNEIVFPAGILQFPMFDKDADDAMNYGGIGMVIGHEITHGFDDQGSQYDKDGNLNNWWTKEDNEKFKAKGKQVVDLYNKFTVLDSVHVNGALTLGENMADIGGVAIAYEAFKLTKQGQDTARISGYTPDQRFFLSIAQCWRRKAKDEAMLKQINTDPHSPAMYRVWGPMMNFTPFYKAFNIQPGDKMFVAEKDRITIW